MLTCAALVSVPPRVAAASACMHWPGILWRDSASTTTVVWPHTSASTMHVHVHVASTAHAHVASSLHVHVVWPHTQYAFPLGVMPCHAASCRVMPRQVPYSSRDSRQLSLKAFFCFSLPVLVSYCV